MRIHSKAIPKFNGLKQRISGDADNKELRQAILDALPEAVEQTKDLAPYFRTTSDRETAKKIFDFLKKRVKYRADDYKQVIQLPSAILRPGAIADCKSLSLFTAAILQNLGIPWHFVLASYSDSTIPGHIYVQTDGGIIIDVVWGKFNSEKKPNYRYKMRYKTTGAGLGAYEPIDGFKDTWKKGKTWVKSKFDQVENFVKETTSDIKDFFQQPQTSTNEGAQEWAIRNGVWYSYSPSERIAMGYKKASPIWAAARGIVLTAISSNSGGLASMLKQLDIQSTAQNPEFKQSSFDKKRTIELEWLEIGGNPNEFYEAYEKGKDKQPRGKYFAELLKRKANGASINPAQWIAGMANALFGKKYTPQQGITGEPVATTATTVATSASWIPVLQKIVAALGSAIVTLIVSRVAAGPREPTENEIKMAETDTTVTLQEPDLKPKTNYTPYIIGGVVIAGLAAIYLTQKKK